MKVVTKWLICGGRDFQDKELFENVTNRFMSSYGLPFEIISGGARGADFMAEKFAEGIKAKSSVFPAEWGKYGKAAGHIRNQQMLDEGKPDIVIAFPGGRGTADMVQKALRAGLVVWDVLPDGTIMERK